MIALPFKFYHKDDSAVIYTAESINEAGEVVIAWDAYRDAGGSTYCADAVELYVSRGTWVVVEQKVDLRSALKIRLFEMRIAEMEKNLNALKREFEIHKQDVKGTH
jgi:hypothetical protein